MIEIQTITIRLGEKDYVIREAPHVRATTWRRRIMEEIKPLFEQVSGVTGIQFQSPADLLQLLPVAERLFVDGLDQVFDLLIAYSPELEADRATIEANASDRQIFAAFQEVLRLADFFGLIPQLQRAGLEAIRGTSLNSPSPNGAAHSAKRKASQNAR
jgi:hypothetical protein